jgi:hypothetical protein
MSSLFIIISVPESAPRDEETVSTLRNRLNTMKELFGEENDGTVTDAARRKRAAKRRNANCLDSLIDGSFMGFVMGVCLIMVLGAAFFAYKNLYYAVIKKMYPDKVEL